MVQLFEELIAKKRRGIFKIYLGYAAGVGKTYAMLQEGHRLKAQGINIVIGYVEPHDRPQTTVLVSGLEIVPGIKVDAANQSFIELDVDAIIKRRPQIVLVDELAHTNFKGSKNEKRYQDVYAILDAGINVISTMNVQHLESVADKVTQGTGVPVAERLPDHVLSSADQVVIIDVTMEDLRERLRLGKIYAPDQAKSALNNFFSHENLSFLREICLREGAGDQIRKIEMQGLLSQTATDLAEESVLAALSSNPDRGEALLRKAIRIAAQLSTQCYAVYVQTTAESPTRIDSARQRQLQKTMKLAKSLGAEVITIQSDDIASALINFTARNHIKHVVFGRPRVINLWSSMIGNVVQNFLRDAIGVDVHVVTLNTKDNNGKNLPNDKS
jgi:two-component system sensor histidine kinase KdpD